MKVDTNLKKMRLEKHLTQAEVQAQTGISQVLLSKYETQKRLPPTKTLIILADFYNVSIDYLLCRTQSQRPEDLK